MKHVDHHFCSQEAVSVGLEYGIEKDDRVITAYRCHPFAIMRGGTIKGVRLGWIELRSK